MRDYLADAQKWMGAPVPLRQMLAQDYPLAVAAIVGRLKNEDTYTRKYAAYALGQIGDHRVLDKLQEAHDSEPADGVRLAMASSLKTIRKMPANSGATEEQRCQYMQEVYEAGMPDDIRQKMLAGRAQARPLIEKLAAEARETMAARGESPKPQGASSTAAKASSGCLVTVGIILLSIVCAALLLAR